MFRRLLIPALVTLAILIAAGAVAATGSSSVTSARLERSLPVVFANLYAKQERLQGKPVIPVGELNPQAQCMRIGANAANDGPGGDWACLMSWQDPDLPMPAEGWGKFEINVRSNACYTATGPSKLIGLLTIPDAHGNDVTNPLNEFDACFDPNGDNTPTGVAFPALVSVTSTTLEPTGHTIQPDILCTLGSGRCAGTVTASADGKKLGNTSYDLNEGITGTLSFPAPTPAAPVTLTFKPNLGRAPTTPVTLPIAAA